MLLTNNILNKLLNSKYIKSVYPMIDKIDTYVEKDLDDDPYPLYTIYLTIIINDNEITSNNMYEKHLDPHYLVDYHLVNLLRMIGVSKRDIIDVHIRVVNNQNKTIYP